MTHDEPAGSTLEAQQRPWVLLAAAVLLLAGLFWQVRAVLSPLVLYPLLCAVLWPYRWHGAVLRLLLATGALTGVWFLWTHGSVLAPFLLALAIAYFLAPAVTELEHRGVPRSPAILMLLLPFLLIVVLGLALLIPAAQRQLTSLIEQIPELARRVADWALELRTRFLANSGGLLTDAQAERLRNLQPSDLVSMFNAQWEDVVRRVWSTAMGFARGVGALVGVLSYVVVTPVVTYYLLKSWRRFTVKIEELVPPARREAAFGFLQEYDRLLGRYVRGQLVEATFVGFLTGGALWLLGFPGALLVGLIAALGNLVPYIGLPLSMIPGLLFALVSGSILPNLLKLLAVFAVVQFVDGSITGPRIVGRSVGLNPVWVMIALVLFGSLLGFVGILVAVPLAVFVKMLVGRWLDRYKASALYRPGAA